MCAAGVRAANALGSAGRALQEALAAEVAAHDSTASQVCGPCVVTQLCAE